VKIRRGAKLISEDSATTAVNNAHFTIGKALPTFNNQAGSNQPKPSGDRPVSFLGADSKPPAEAKVNLFQNNNNGLFNNNTTLSAPESKSLFANNNNTSNGGSLFSTNTGPSLFGKPQEEALSNNVTTGLNIFNNNASSGNIFANNSRPDTSESEKPTDTKTSEDRLGVRLFKNSTGDLFQKQLMVEKKESPKAPTSGGLFSNLAQAATSILCPLKKTGNIFSGISTNGPSIFGNSTKHSEKSPEKTEANPKPSLFGNLGNSGGGLFSGLLSSSNNNTNASSKQFILTQKKLTYFPGTFQTHF
jgi:hypothetical protein